MSDANSPQPELTELARRHGVDVEFTDWRGEHRAIDAEVLIEVLAALGVDASGPEAITAALSETELAPWRHLLPPSIVMRQEPRVMHAHVPHGAPVRLMLLLEDGGRREPEQLMHWTDPREVDGVLTGRATFELPGDLPKGWHRLAAWAGQPGDAEAPDEQHAPDAVVHCIVVPSTAAPAGAERAGADSAGTERGWGVMAQAYQLRSRDSWGIGDLADIASLAEWAGERGADFALVNPLHAPDPVAPIEPSPYLPSTRRFLDPAMLRIEDIPGAALLSEQAAQRAEELAREARKLNEADAIDRTAAWEAKREALSLLHAADLLDPERSRAFGAFCEREGQGLVDFASYCALAERHGRDWRRWPEELQDPASPRIAAFRQEHAGHVDFFRWLQWVLDEQLAATQERAVSAGMRYGIVHDLAVGVHPSGADAWMLPGALARGVSAGAPPDMFNQLGQDWSQPPWRPDRLAELGYVPYRDMLRTVLRHAGGLRVDHIIGLFRLWWIPAGRTAAQGTYVRYDAEAMLGILLLEAERAGAIVIGEDLGVVEPSARETMRERGVYGTSVMWFEWCDGQPLDPGAYRELCLATVTTHDLPPTAGYLALEHVTLRDRLGLLTVPAEQEREREAGVIAAVREALSRQGLAEPGAPDEEAIIAMHAWLAAGRARLFGVSLADLAGDRRAVNQPGTHLEYPNWSLPLASSDGRVLSLEELLASPLAQRIAEVSRRT